MASDSTTEPGAYGLASRETAPPVFMRPAWSGKNRYTAMLADALEQNGLKVNELGYGPASIPDRTALLFYHWPDEFFVFNDIRRVQSAVRTVIALKLGKMRYGHRIIWLAHNVSPHRFGDGARPFPLLRGYFLRLIDGFVCLSEDSKAQLITAYPRLEHKPSLVIPHGDYRHDAITAVTEAPQVAGRDVRLGLIGMVKRYKAPVLLAQLVAEQRGVTVTIAGECSEAALASQLEAIASVSPRVTLKPGRLSEAELEASTDAVDAVVLPYRQILNSGSALFALSRKRPVIAPRLGSLPELQRQVGANWLWLYDGEFSAETLSAAVNWLRSRKTDDGPDLSAHGWSNIGEKVSAFLKGL